MTAASFPSLLQSFFTDRLLRQRAASPHTIAGYRDCFRLLLQFAKESSAKCPLNSRSKIWTHHSSVLFLDHLERTRKNSARTRNARLAAIHSFFRYIALEEPAHALHCHRILAVPSKRMNNGQSSFWIEKRSMLCSPFLILPAGSDAGTKPASASGSDGFTGIRADKAELPACRNGDRSPCALPG